MLKEHEINTLDNFIGGYYIDSKICDALIYYYKTNPNKKRGTVGDGKTGKSYLNETIKKDTECFLENKDLFDIYVKSLHEQLQHYIKKYKWCDSYAPWNIIEPIKIQHYLPNEGYYDWHTERCSPSYPFTTRHLVFLTYLNDVNDDGETEFFYQKVKVKPEKGLTIFWPADWTFTHRGITSPSEEKYIVTGWYNYVPSL